MNNARNVRERNHLNQERLKALLHYDPDSGIFRWVGTKAHRIRNGEIAGSKNKRYVFISLNYKLFTGHRLAFLYMTGSMPAMVDHINGEGTDNRWCNLRPCNPRQNTWNVRKDSLNTSGFKGVTFCKTTKRWRAQIKFYGVHRCLGRYDSPEEAHAAYVAKAQELFGEFARAV